MTPNIKGRNAWWQCWSCKTRIKAARIKGVHSSCSAMQV
jgi:hypothetical protein